MACDLGETDGCALAGQLFAASQAADPAHFGTANGSNPFVAQALGAFRVTCYHRRSPNKDACNSLAEAYLHHLGTSGALDSALMAARRGCDLGSATACAHAGMLVRDRRDLGPERQQAARELLQRAADSGSVYGRGRLAFVLDRARLEEEEASEHGAAAVSGDSILGLWDASCRVGEWLSCNDLGEAKESTRYATRAQPASARHLYEMACAGSATGRPSRASSSARGGRRDTLPRWSGNGNGCRNLGRMYLDAPAGSGIAQPDTIMAVQYFRIGCELFEPSSCGWQARYGLLLHRADATRREAVMPFVAFMLAATACVQRSADG